MTQSGHTHEALMSGHGFYNRHSVIQAAAAELGLVALRAATESVPLPSQPRLLFVADYGCSQGQNSLRPIGEAVSTLRKRTDLPVTVVHTDLPGNDFSAVFETVANDPSSYAVVDSDTYVLAAGRSFYEEVLPPGSVTLGWSATTTHWLSEAPCPVPGHLSAQMTSDTSIRDRFAARADADWRCFLQARAAEFQPGGRVVMVEPCARPDGRTGSENVMGVMDQVMAELVTDGRLAAEAAAAATLPVWLRTPDEYEAPIGDHADLELVDGQVVEGLKSPLWAQFERDRDPAAYADASIGAMRAWSEAMLAASITDAATLDAFYDRCRVLGAEDPERLHIQVFHAVLDIARC